MKTRIKFSKIKPHLPIILIITLALVLRIIALVQYGDFWSDEMFSFVYSQKSWMDSWRFWVWETNPPLYTFIMKLWFFIFPDNEIFARIPSIVFGTANVLAIYIFSKKIFSKNIAITAALLLALNPTHVLYSATNRTYALLLLLATISTVLFYQLFIEEKTDKKTTALFAITNCLLLYAHLTSILFFGCQLIILLAYKKSFWKWIKYNIIPGLFWLIWAIPSFGSKLSFSTVQNTWFFNLQNVFTLKLYNLQLILLGPINNIWSIILLITFLVLALGLVIYQKRKSFDPNLFFVIIFATIPVALTLLTNFNAPKFFLISLPWLMILLGYVIHNLCKRLTITTPIIILAYCFSLFLFFQHFPLASWDQVNNFLNQYRDNGKTQLFIYESYVNKNEIERYVKNDIAKIPYIPTQNADMDWNRMLITQNYFRLEPKLEELKLWVNKNDLTKNENIFILQYKTNTFVHIDLVSAFKELGYRVTKQTTTEVLSSPTFYLLEKVHE